MSENEKIEVHPDFELWYDEIGSKWSTTGAQKACALLLINQMGFGHGLENSRKETVSGDYPVLAGEMQAFKEKYSRAVLDGFVVRKEKLYYVRFPHLDGDDNYLNHDFEKDAYCLSDKVRTIRFKTKFTIREIEAIDKRYVYFAVLVNEID